MPVAPTLTQSEATPAAPSLEAVAALAKAAGDQLRCTVLRVLREESYGVLELCQILEIAQPALSHHLKILHGAGLLARRREGNSVFYRRASTSGGLERALLERIDSAPVPDALRQRIDQVHDERRQRSEAFFREHAAEFQINQARISETAAYRPGILELIDSAGCPGGRALEIGPGEGGLLEALSRRFDDVEGMDSSRNMLNRAAAAVAGRRNVQLTHGDFMTLTRSAAYQLVVAAMVVHHLASPPGFFRQAARLLSAGGLLVVAELCSHDNEWARQACGDQWLGFEPQELASWAENAGLLPLDSQFLAQKNGFQIQIHSYCKQ